MSKFRVGDRVHYLTDPTETGTIKSVATSPGTGQVWYTVNFDKHGDLEYMEKSLKLIETSNDVVNNPRHYQSESGIEVIDVIEAFDLDRYRSNATKYILRAGNKGDFDEDIDKAIWYLQRLRKWRDEHAND
jgi:hypothetical protein